MGWPGGGQLPLSLLTWLVILWVEQWRILRAPGRAAYMTPARDALLAVKLKGDPWRVEAFYTARSGGTNTAALWEHTVEALKDTARRHDQTVQLVAANRRVAEHYRGKSPGLREVGVKRGGQVVLQWDGTPDVSVGG